MKQFCFCALAVVLGALDVIPARAVPASVFPILGEHGIGTGTLCDSSGLLLTERRQVMGTIAPKVMIAPNRVVMGQVVAEDPEHGIAIVWINPSRIMGYPVLTLMRGEEDHPGLTVGDAISGLTTRIGEGPLSETGFVRAVHGNRLDTTLPFHFADLGGALLDSRGRVVGILRSGGAGPGAAAAPIEDAAALLEAVVESTRTWLPPSGENLPALPDERFPPDDLRALAARSDRDIRDYRILAGGYTVSILTPPQCFALQSQPSEAPTGWFLSGAFGDGYPPVVAIHVEPRKSSTTFLWPIGAIARVGRGAAHVLGSIVGTVADGVTGGGPATAPPAARSDHCGLTVLRDGAVEMPLLCQGSGHVYDQKRGMFVQRKGSKAAFFYYSWPVFQSKGERPPAIVLELSDPGAPDERDRLEVPRKLLQMIAADFEPMSRSRGEHRPVVASRPRDDGAGAPAASGPLLLIRLKGGSILRAVEAEAWGPRDVRIVLEARERIFIPRDEIHSIVDEDGVDWTERVLTDENGVNRNRKSSGRGR